MSTTRRGFFGRLALLAGGVFAAAKAQFKSEDVTVDLSDGNGSVVSTISLSRPSDEWTVWSQDGLVFVEKRSWYKEEPTYTDGGFIEFLPDSAPKDYDPELQGQFMRKHDMVEFNRDHVMVTSIWVRPAGGFAPFGVEFYS